MSVPESASRPPTRGLRLLDLVGFVAGFGFASLLARTVWPRFTQLSGPPAVAFALEFCWLGLAMSGPIILRLERRRPPAATTVRPERPGRRIGEVAVISPRSSLSRPPLTAGSGPTYSRAELAWMCIGSYWIVLTFFLVPIRVNSTLWTLAGIIPVVVTIGLALPTRSRPPSTGPSPPRGWTHAVATGLIWTWPVAWALLILLGRTL